MGTPSRIPDAFLRIWQLVPGPGAAWLEALAPLQFVAYPLRDSEGRPLGEANAPIAVRRDVAFDIRACPYADSRHGQPMNATPLPGVRDHWPWIVESVGVLRAAWAERDPDARGPLDLVQAWGFSAAVLCLPMFLLRTGAATDGTVPVEVGALFKVVQGVYMGTWDAWRRGHRALDVDAVVAHLQAHDGLFNPLSLRVCAGPAALIREIVAACVLPSPHTGPTEGSGSLLDYGSRYAALSLEKWLLDRAVSEETEVMSRHRDRLAGWERAPETAIGRITELQRSICLTVGARPPSQDFDPRWIPKKKPA